MKNLLFLFIATICPFGDYIVDYLQLYPRILEGLFIAMLGVIGYILIFYIPDKLFGGDNNDNS